MTISVVIPYYNESDTLPQTLNALKNQTFKADEIIFIDSGSTDNSTSIIESFSKNNTSCNIKSYRSGLMSPSTSINLGIKKSNSNIIAYTDCGLNIPKNWLKSNYELMTTTNASIVSPQFFTKGKNIIDMSFVAHTYGCGSYTSVLPGSLIKKTVIENVGYFLPDVRANYDVDFINKIKNLGIKRIINESITFKYIGIEYCKSFSSGFLKISKYSENAWKVKNDFKPFLYTLGLVVLILSTHFDYISKILLFYFVLRGYVLPVIKSSYEIILNIPLLLILPVTGAVIDFSRIVGYLHLHKLINR
jgi:glycosyltransferase involved in cell wall biosynthesis